LKLTIFKVLRNQMRIPRYIQKGILVFSVALWSSATASASQEKNVESGAALCREIQPFADSLARSLESRQDGSPDRIIAADQDSRYGLPLTAFWSLLEGCWGQAGHKALMVKVRRFPAPAPLKAFCKAPVDTVSNNGNRLSLGTRNLFGEIAIERIPKFRVSLKVSVLDNRAKTLREENLPDLMRLKAYSDLFTSLLIRTEGRAAMESLEDFQHAGEVLERALYSQGKSRALPDQAFAFSHAWTFKDTSGLALVRRILRDHFGFQLEPPGAKVASRIRLLTDGAVEFRFPQGDSLRVDSVVEPPFRVRFNSGWDIKNYTVLLDPPNQAGNSGSRSGPLPTVKRDTLVVPFAKASDRFPKLAASIREALEDKLAKAYGADMGPPDFPYLEQVFSGKESRILKGRVISKREHFEKVQYAWVSGESYLNSLRDKVKLGYRFDVNLDLLRLYQDRVGSTRFWGVVYQDWITRDTKGGKAYHDDGILFVNFDFEPKSGKLEKFRIYYRFWFYNYLTDTWVNGPDGKRKIVTRKERLGDVISAAIAKSHPLPTNVEFGTLNERTGAFKPDPGARGLSGVDTDLLELMRDDLLEIIP
jgi:hypothetical protein